MLSIAVRWLLKEAERNVSTTLRLPGLEIKLCLVALVQRLLAPGRFVAVGVSRTQETPGTQVPGGDQCLVAGTGFEPVTFRL
jgi:hypothetical protein